jgi:hypothetical protein
MVSDESFDSCSDYVSLILIVQPLAFLVVLVGIITDSVTSVMMSIEDGRTRVAESNHTLILGWNEATLRTIVQVCWSFYTFL